MKFLVWGAGAIGGTIGAHLARAGHDITFVDRAEEHVAAINKAGLRIEGPLTQFVCRIPSFTPDELNGEFERIVLAVKAQDTEAATRALAAHLSADGYVVSAQNGLNELIIKDVVGDARTMGCFVNFGADYLEPGLIQYAGRGAVVLGEIASRKRRTETDAQLGPIVTLGAEAGVATPLVSRLIELMHEIEEGKRPQSHATLDLLRAAVLTG